MVARRRKIPSLYKSLGVMLIGLIIAVPPKIKPRLKILDPTTFPIDISVWPVMAAFIVTANSGADVPKATTVSPITRSDIFKECAISAAASTSQSAPFHSIKIEIITKNKSIAKFKKLHLLSFYKYVNSIEKFKYIY